MASLAEGKTLARIETSRVEAMIQYVMFSILVVMTPFVVVTNYLQGIVAIFSHLSLKIGDVEIPYVVLAVILLIIFLLIKYFGIINRRKVIAFGVIIVMIMIAHRVQDRYLDMSFFDLQQNWHYTTFGAYVFFFFRAYNARKMKMNKLILYSYASAVLMALFDESFQYFLSHRTFDLSDTAKDAMGGMLGIITVIFISETYGTIDLKNLKLSKQKLSEYFKDPATCLLMIVVLTWSAILISPLLSQHEYILHNVLAIFAFFLIIMSIVHFWQYRKFRIGFVAVVAVLVLGLGGSFLINMDEGITHTSHGIMVYKGIPLPFFDILIFQNGTFVFTDKKHHFSEIDIRYFMKQKPDILLIGGGSLGKGGKGFKEKHGTYFRFNRYSGKGTQIIILNTPDAVKEYNRLREEGKNVLFVIHNTC